MFLNGNDIYMDFISVGTYNPYMPEIYYANNNI